MVPRRSARASALAVLTSALVALAPAAPAAAVPVQDSVTGTATTLGTDVPGSPVVTWTFAATSGPGGENPSGTVRAAQPPSDTTFFEGPVTCLNAHATVALLTIQTPQLGPVSIRVTDNAGAGAPDLIESTPSSLPATCSVPEPSYIRHDTVTSGDIVVVDAQPPLLPANKDQCKNGGWRASGAAFRNQGQCVAFVERGPKP
jgi:hypothetical protein